MAFTVKSDHIVMDALDVTELRHLIAETNKGSLTLMIRKGESSYRLVLDAVPLDDEKNKELMAVLFPVKEREIQQVNKTLTLIAPNGQTETLEVRTIQSSEGIKVNTKGELIVKKKGGRPKGSKNGDKK